MDGVLAAEACSEVISHADGDTRVRLMHACNPDPVTSSIGIVTPEIDDACRSDYNGAYIYSLVAVRI